MSDNRYASAHSVATDLPAAVFESTALINDAFSGERPDLVLAFVAGYPNHAFDAAMPGVSELTGCINVIGVSCRSFISGDKEFENQVGIGLWAAKFKSAEIVPMHLNFHSSGGETHFSGWPDAIDGDWPHDTALIMLAEPFSFPVDALLDQLNQDRPGVKVIGGIADGADAPKVARLLLGKQTYDHGAVAVRMTGVSIETVVSQGCRPIGSPQIVTRSERNIVHCLGGQSAFDALKTIYDQLPTQDKARVEQGLHLGIAMTEMQDHFGYGDFLIRNVIGIDENEGSIRLADYVQMGKTVQFHVRDSDSASVELKEMLKSRQHSQTHSAAALIFTCNGRGLYLFEDPDHDAAAVGESIGAVPVAGFFAAGEIGAVKKQNFLHGFTASIAIFP